MKGQLVLWADNTGPSQGLATVMVTKNRENMKGEVTSMTAGLMKRKDLARTLGLDEKADIDAALLENSDKLKELLIQRFTQMVSSSNVTGKSLQVSKNGACFRLVTKESLVKGGGKAVTIEDAVQALINSGKSEDEIMEIVLEAKAGQSAVEVESESAQEPATAVK